MYKKKIGQECFLHFAWRFWLLLLGGVFSVFWGESVAYFHLKMSNFENTAVSSWN